LRSGEILAIGGSGREYEGNVAVKKPGRRREEMEIVPMRVGGV
jgi:hypothetical protein